uniref:Uncharacterized protein n=1 Tax=Faxonius propinquus nudivirus TaxID=3139431 RepID=A0AAU8GCX6_9VIRU
MEEKLQNIFKYQYKLKKIIAPCEIRIWKNLHYFKVNLKYLHRIFLMKTDHNGLYHEIIISIKIKNQYIFIEVRTIFDPSNIKKCIGSMFLCYNANVFFNTIETSFDRFTVFNSIKYDGYHNIDPSYLYTYISKYIWSNLLNINYNNSLKENEIINYFKIVNIFINMRYFIQNEKNMIHNITQYINIHNAIWYYLTNIMF